MIFIEKQKKNQTVLVIILWLIATLININKAFHIDDTFHLEAAQWIATAPTKPMFGFINWNNYPEQIFHFNQPPLYFYLVAIVGEIFGYNELILHLFQSVFTFLAIYFFSKITSIIYTKPSKILLILFTFCPAFLVNQNLMTDMPILSLELIFIYCLIKPNFNSKFLQYGLASLILGLALLIKYSMFPLIVVLFVSILLEKQYKYLLFLLIPISMLVIWSLSNYFQHHSIHIFNRPRNEFSFYHILKQSVQFVSCLGAVSPFSILFFNKFRSNNKLIFVAIISLLLFVLLIYLAIIPEHIASNTLNILFVINGSLLLTIISLKIATKGIQIQLRAPHSRVQIIICLWFAALSAFIILYAPFMATRHVLLIIPCILLFAGCFIKNTSKKRNQVAIISTCILGLLLSLSDWQYADFYRRMAKNIELLPNIRAWSVGHWGWQWYAQKNKMMQYHTNVSIVKNGDYIIYPANIAAPTISPGIKLIKIKKIWEKPNGLTFFSVNNFASMYSSSLNKGPWRLSLKPLDTIIVSRVEILP